MIVVVNKRTHKPTSTDAYIGRGSPLGNHFPMSATVSRERCIEMYRIEFNRMITQKINNHLNYDKCRKQLYDIYNLHKKGTVYLVCYCAPLACHGDVIKQFIEQY
jgi:hypothetical protein